jgi:hypothetical protein
VHHHREDSSTNDQATKRSYITHVRKKQTVIRSVRVLHLHRTHSCCFPLILHPLVSSSARFSRPSLSGSFPAVTQFCNKDTQLYISALGFEMILELKTKSFLLCHKAQEITPNINTNFPFCLSSLSHMIFFTNSFTLLGIEFHPNTSLNTAPTYTANEH